MKTITVWESRSNSDNSFSHNHISDGFDPDFLTPTPVTSFQGRSWAGKEWKKVRAWLSDGVVLPASKNN